MPRLLKKTDKATALRLRRQVMAIYSYALAWAGIYGGVELGLFDVDTPHWGIFIALMCVNIVIYIAIRSGASTSLKDPSLTAVQMTFGVIAVTAILHYSSEIRGSMTAIYFMIMTFGVFALSRSKMVLMSLFILTSYTILTFWEWHAEPHNQIFAISLGQWAILALGLAWFVYVGGHIYNLQHRIREQRESLRDNHQRLKESHIQLHEAMAQLAEIAVRDELTGLFNRRHFLERLDEALARSDLPLHVALIDLDHFKLVNDKHGHQVGDLVLRKFSDIAKRELRRSDVVARYGGEEFIILFTEGSTADIKTVLERLRIEFALACSRDISPDLSTTMSIGLAAWAPSDRPETITLRADNALYRAKDLGRNRLAVA